MTIYTQEQLEVLMMVAGSESPTETAIAIRQRWRYILAVARAARQRDATDWSLAAIRRAEAIIAALDEWLSENAGKKAG